MASVGVEKTFLGHSVTDVNLAFMVSLIVRNVAVIPLACDHCLEGLLETVAHQIRYVPKRLLSRAYV